MGRWLPPIDRRPRALAALGCALGLAMAPTLAAAAEPTIDIAQEVQARLGVKTIALSMHQRASQVDAFAKVLDPGPLAQLQSDLLAAEAAAAASKAEAQRSRALNVSGGSIADKDVEAAVAQAAADQSKLALLRQRIGLEWGPGIARMSAARRAALIADLAKGQTALVHVDTPDNEGQDGARSVDIDIGPNSGSAHGIVLGAARQAEPRLQSSGLIVEVKGPLAILLSIGLTQSAHINHADAVSGVVLPRSAVIRFEGSDWCYVRRGATRFERRLIDTPAPEQDGLFVAKGFAAGDQVIVQGAAEVFAVEQAQRTRAR